MRVLAISGSLRAQSSNKTLLEALGMVAAVEVFEGLAGIPGFNPDIEATVDSVDLARFREAVRLADAVVFSTPEYAHGIPGVLKNALDWIVGSGELSGKPVTLLNASSRGVHAQAALREVLRTMDARYQEAAETTIEAPGKKLTAEQIVAEPRFAAELRACLDALR